MKAPYAEKHYNIMNFNKSCSFEGKNFRSLHDFPLLNGPFGD